MPTKPDASAHPSEALREYDTPIATGPATIAAIFAPTVQPTVLALFPPIGGERTDGEDADAYDAEHQRGRVPTSV